MARWCTSRPGYKQKQADVTPLKEEDAYPAEPEPGYGWEKLYTEQLCQYYWHDYKFETRIVRFHNVYGPLGTPSSMMFTPWMSTDPALPPVTLPF